MVAAPTIVVVEIFVPLMVNVYHLYANSILVLVWVAVAAGHLVEILQRASHKLRTVKVLQLDALLCLCYFASKSLKSFIVNDSKQ